VRRSPGSRPSSGNLIELLASIGAGLVVFLLLRGRELPLWLGLVLLVGAFGGAYLLTFQRLLKVALSVETEGTVCPRCEAHPRTTAGWCTACTAVLVDRRPGPDHPVHRLLSVRADDIDGVVRCYADPIRMKSPGGGEITMSRKAWRRSIVFSRWIRRDRHNRLLGVHAEPDNPDVVWLHTDEYARGRLWFDDLDARFVSRLGFVHGLIAEHIVAPAQPRGVGTGPAGNPAPVTVAKSAPTVDPARSVGPPPRA
jgi:hypothetical protein